MFQPIRFVLILGICIPLVGCAAITQKRSNDFQTTATFLKSCEDLESAQKELKRMETKGKGFFARLNPLSNSRVENKSGSFFSELNPATHFRAEPQDRIQEQETAISKCLGVDLARMLADFLSIKETDEQRGIRGNTFAEVREKGFTLYEDKAGRIQRQNVSQLYGNDALTAIGVGVAPPQLQASQIDAYKEYMRHHYGEKYIERDMHGVIDRICLNRRDSLKIGYEYEFIIVWQRDHVYKRVIKGGPINNPKSEKGILVCIVDDLGEFLKGGVQKGMNILIP